MPLKDKKGLNQTCLFCTLHPPESQSYLPQYLLVPLHYFKFYFLNYCAVFVQAVKRTQFTQTQNAPFSHVGPGPASGGKKILAGKIGRRKPAKAMLAPPPRAMPAPPHTMQSCLCAFSFFKTGKGERARFKTS